MIIVLEGLDGSGKTTICDALRERGAEVVHSTVPQGFLPEVRLLMQGDIEKYVAFDFMYYLCSAKFSETQVLKAKDEGKDVVLDRYVYSTLATHLAFDKLYNGSANSDQIARLAREAEKSVLKPDLVIFLNIDRKERLKRLARRECTKIDANERLMYLFANEFKAIFPRLRESGVAVVEVDNSRSLGKTMDEITSAISAERNKKTALALRQK